MLRSAITNRSVLHCRLWAVIALVGIGCSFALKADARLVPFPHKSSSVTLRKIKDLNFGGAFTGSTKGTVVVQPNGNVYATSPVIRNTAHGIHAAEPARFSFTIYNSKHCKDNDHCNDDDDQCDRREDDDHHSDDDRHDFTRHGTDVTLSLPSSSKLYKSGSSSVYMTADHFTLSRTDGYFNVGATLNVGANQAVGSYSGTFSVTVVCD